MVWNPFGDTVPMIGVSGSSSGIPLPELNPAFHDVGFSAPVTGSVYGGNSMSSGPVGDVFSAVSEGVSGIGGIFTSGLNAARDITQAYNEYDAAANPRQGINTQQLLLIGGGILALILVLK